MMDSKFVYKKHVKKATVTQLIFLFVFSGNNTVRGGPGGAILPVATDNGRRSVPLGPWRICNGSPTYSDLRE